MRLLSAPAANSRCTCVAAKGRYLISGGSLYFHEVCALLARLLPDAKVPTQRAPGSALKPNFDYTRATQDWGWAPRTAEEALTEQVAALVAAGMAQ